MEAFSFERKIKHYSSYQRILLVGEGDFSFSVCLARAFGLAVNLVATSLDSRESLMLKYSKALSNVKELEARGCIVLHEVDVHSMSQHPFLIRLRFDRIIYNFPHAGYLLGPFSSEHNRFQIWFHQDLIRGFLKNARELLTAIGEIHVTHKTTFPFSEWKIVELAHEVGLYLVDEEPFSLWDYPGYENKRGDGMCDQTFPVGLCSTFKFAKLFYHSSPSCFHLGITASGPWSGYSGINSSRMERWHPTVKAKPILEEKIQAEEPDPGKKTRRLTITNDACISQKILLVGEGNFSFAACLAKEFGSAVKMVATSFDSKESLMQKYSNVMSTLNELKGKGCTVLHEVDVHTMSQHPQLTNRQFDRIVFNFPHAGFILMEHNKIQIKLHQDLVKGYFTSAREMLTESGEVHVTHKTTHPFSKWNIVTLAEEVGLFLVEEAQFTRADYPGYINKKGTGRKCNRTFRVGQCSAYKFAKLPLQPYFPS